jgi:hypothetical protein
VFPAELEGVGLDRPPSPAIRRKAESLVKGDSEGDMLKIARDLLYSPLFSLMPYDYTGEKRRNEDASSVEELFRTPDEVLAHNRGVAISKSRLLCSMASSLGIPSKTVVTLKGYGWSELWIQGLDWVPVDTAFPVYDYPWPQRVSFPKRLFPGESLVSSDTSAKMAPLGISWTPPLPASVVTGQYNLLKDPNQFMQTKLIIARPSWRSNLENEVMLEILPDHFLFLQTRENREILVIRDRKARDVKRVLLSAYDSPLTIDLRPDLTWVVLPKKRADYVIIETLEWKKGAGSLYTQRNGEDLRWQRVLEKNGPPLGERKNR